MAYGYGVLVGDTARLAADVTVDQDAWPHGKPRARDRVPPEAGLLRCEDYCACPFPQVLTTSYSYLADAQRQVLRREGASYARERAEGLPRTVLPHHTKAAGSRKPAAQRQRREHQGPWAKAEASARSWPRRPRPSRRSGKVFRGRRVLILIPHPPKSY